VTKKEEKAVNFEEAHAITDRTSCIEQSLFLPSRIPEHRAQKASLLDKMKHYGIPGVSVAIIHQGRIEWAKGYGVQDAETQEPVTSETLFQAASISKLVTAVAVLRLVDARWLDLDEDVNTYLLSWQIPNNMSWQPRVTLRQLLCHGAGVAVHGFPGYTHDAVVPTLEQVLKGQKPANTDPIRINALPGTQFRYSGGGYCILQHILMDVTGQPFPELMRELVLNPLGMRQSTFDQPLPLTLVSTAATGHCCGGKPIFGKWHIYPEMAAAGLWTTPSDLARFALAIQRAWAGETTNCLSQEMVCQMLTPQVELFTGLGPRLDGEGTSSRFSHTGGNKGFMCLLEAYVHQSFGAVVMTNSDAGFFVIKEIMSAFAQEYDWPDYLPKEAVALESALSISDVYIGEYELKPGFSFTIFKQGNKLFLQPTGQNALVLYPETETIYFLKEVDAQVTFVREDQEEVTHLIFKQNSTEMVAKRMKT
jgi:CubicO group peptidase (beta-lactamase class C family)